MIVTRRPADLGAPPARRSRSRGTGGRSEADLQQQVTFAEVPEIPTAIPILVRTDLQPSTSGRAVFEEEEEVDSLQPDPRLSPERLTLSSDSSGYSPSPDRNMPLQPISLLDELNLGSRAPRAASRASTAAPLVASNQSPTERQRDKRPAESPQHVEPPTQRRRTGESGSSLVLTDSPPLVQPWAPVLARPDGTPLNVIDRISSVDVAFGISRAALLPLDMEKERGNSYDVLMKSVFQSSARV